MNHELLNVREAAQKMRVSVTTVRRLIDSGQLPAARVGSGVTSPIRIRPTDIEILLWGAASDDLVSGESV
jgi:excisionase family DNA binding protein